MTKCVCVCVINRAFSVAWAKCVLQRSRWIVLRSIHTNYTNYEDVDAGVSASTLPSKICNSFSVSNAVLVFSCGCWVKVGLMMVITLALSWGVVFICWQDLHVPWSVSATSRSYADWLWFIGSHPNAWQQSTPVAASDQTVAWMARSARWMDDWLSGC